MISVDRIIKYESGEMSPQEELEFFAELIKSGDAWKLQGIYGRTAKAWIDSGYIDNNGHILKNFGEDEA